MNEITEDDKNLAREKFDLTHKKIVGILEEYLLEGWAGDFAKILTFMDEGEARDVLSKMEEPMRNKVESAYETALGAKRTEPETIATVGRILKKSGFYGKAISDEVTAGLSTQAALSIAEDNGEFVEKDPIIALNVERYFVKFSDLLLLDDRSIQRCLRDIDQIDLAKALIGADGATQDKIFRNMSRRAASMLKEDIEFMGPVRTNDVMEAQMKFVKIMMRLDASGDIVLRGNELIAN